MVLKFKKKKPKKRPVKLSFFKPAAYHPKRSKRDWKLIDKNPFGDKDGDRVPNIFDCKPYNKKKQGKFSQNIPIENAKYITLYHGVYYKDMPSILKKGLDSNKLSEESKTHHTMSEGEDIEKGIYLSPNIAYAGAYPVKGISRGQGHVVQVTLKKDKFLKELEGEDGDIHYQKNINKKPSNFTHSSEYLYMKDIPPHNIKILNKENVIKKFKRRTTTTFESEKNDEDAEVIPSYLQSVGKYYSAEEKPETLQSLKDELREDL